MFRLLALVLLSFAGVSAFAQESMTHEPTSATDSEVRLHNTKKSKFMRSGKSRKTEQEGKSIKDAKYKSEARTNERHGKSVRRSRGTKRMNGEARVFKKHGVSASSKSTRKSKVKRSLGRSTEE
jgi:hypothetical protein